MTMHARTITTLLTLVGLATSAFAEDIDGVVVVGGTAEARDAATIATMASAIAKETAWLMPAKPLAKKEVDQLLQCGAAQDVATCIPPALTRRGMRRALAVTADKQQATDGGLIIVLTGRLVIVNPPQVLVQVGRCEPCTDDALAEATTIMARKLTQELAVRDGRTLIAVTSNPQGASIVLDKDRVGATPMTVKTYPGRHVIQIEKPGYRSYRRELEATEAGTVDVSADLVSTTEPVQVVPVNPATSPASREGWWHLPAAVMVAGGALAVAGGTALYLGQQDGPDDRTRYTRATPIGIGVLLVGGAAIGYGAFRLWRGPGIAGPVVGPTEHGAVVGVAGRF